MNITKSEWIATQPWIDQPNPDFQRYLDKYSESCGFDLEQKLRDWKRDGVVVFEKVVDPQLIDALISDVEYLRKHHMDFDLLAENKGRQAHLREFSVDDLASPGVKFNSIQTISYAAAKLSLTRELVQFMNCIFDDAPCAAQSLTFYKGSQQSLHIDYPYVRTQSKLAHLAATWIPLEDIHPDSGPLAYYPGSHNLDVSGFFDWGNDSILLEKNSTRTPRHFADYLHEQMRKSNVEPKVFCPKKGDALIWHGNLAHQGTTINDLSLTRMSYVTHYTSRGAYPQAFLKPGVPKSGVICDDHGGYVFEYSWQEDLKQLPSAQLFR